MCSIDILKVRSIIIFFVIFSIVINGSTGQSGKLNDTENQHRLETCGGLRFPRPASGSQGESVNDQNKKTKASIRGLKNKINKVEVYTTGTFISPRHMLTSSHLVLNSSGMYRHVNEKLNEGDCGAIVDGRINVDAFKTVNKPEEVSRITVLDLCDPETKKFAGDAPRKLMIVEFKKNIDISLPCLADESTEQPNNLLLDAYGYGWEVNFKNQTDKSHHYNLYHRKLKLLDKSSDFFFTENYTLKHDFGSALVFGTDEKTTLMGIGIEGAPTKQNATRTRFFNLLHYREKLCLFTGVCSGKMTPKVKRPGALTEQEDEERAANCGWNGPEKVTIGPTFIWYSSITLENRPSFPAVVISSRHLIAAIEVRDTTKARESCKKSEMHLYLEGSDLSKFHVSFPICSPDGCKETKVKVARGYIPNFCRPKANMSHLLYPFIVEVSSSVYNWSTPCLVTDKIERQLVKYDTVNNTVLSTEVKVNASQSVIVATSESAQLGTGGALIQISDGQATLIGIGMSNSSINSTAKEYFSMKMLKDSFCELIGICKGSRVNPAVITTPMPEVPAMPQTRTTETRSKPSESREPQPDYDPECEEMTEGKKSKPNLDDVDDDFMLSREDWESGASGWRLELGSLFFIFVLVFWGE